MMFYNYKVFIILIFCFASYRTFAARTSPAGVAGEMKYIVNTPVGTVKFCNGVSWTTTEVSNTGNGCTVPGKIEYQPLMALTPTTFCGGNTVTSTYTLRSMNGAASGSLCTQAGQIEYSSGLSKMRICNNSVWDDVGVASPPNISLSPDSGNCETAIGQSVTHTVTNTGGSATSAITVSLSGPNPGSFTIFGNTCTILAASASCTFDIIFPNNPGVGTVEAQVNVSATTGGSKYNLLGAYGQAQVPGCSF